MIWDRDILTALVLNLEFSDPVIEADDVPFKGSTTPMVYLGIYDPEDLNTRKIAPEE